MSVVPVADVLQGRVAVDQEVTVRGWVRTRRDSKAGISFLAVYDGSCFDPVQAVINNSLPNYNEEVLHLTTGCSVVVTGKVVASPGQGAKFRNPGHESRSRRLGGRSGYLPDGGKTP
ncbi:asparaginyl-tRNA synthetase [Salmonella enterica subsp. enterica]|uniref:Asparaginyl-tRNA synthetase n=1 Tax=Salmonella enterica I TaxID=59201 RepID=A0A3S4LXF4_SALET|nr:asparaginyl-tRNA synthetase [Salmonella enterica subsp. enterica]